MRILWPCYISGFLLAACNHQAQFPAERPLLNDTIPAAAPTDSLVYTHPQSDRVATGTVKPEEVVAFARTLKGVPYQYASCTPESGFDCSGFVYYVFSHFGITVPRSSVGFTNVGQEITAGEAKPGDLILFTGTDSSDKTVGHMGIIVSNEAGDLQFIHSSSGTANGVTTSPLKGYYQGRFMKVIRIFPQNGNAG